MATVAMDKNMPFSFKPLFFSNEMVVIILYYQDVIV